MTSEKEIIPWICHVCDREFNIDSGGLCSECHKATCLNCLGLRIFFGKWKKEKIENAVCLYCKEWCEGCSEPEPSSGKPTEEQREMVIRSLEGNSKVVEFEVGEITTEDQIGDSITSFTVQ